MGQEESTIVDESVRPETLESRTVEALAKYIQDGRAKRVVVMTGAGISTSAGIPDFRSPDTGLYANLARLNLPYAEAVFDISYFRNNPLPFYTLAQELYPGRYRPTITHSFIRLLHDKGLLLKLFTQNIDCLEREAGVPDDKIIEAHGSFARQSCIECKAAFPEDEMKAAIAEKKVPRCAACAGLVKPEIVFFGEQLPAAFFENRDLPAEADLAIVLGTSLTVQPFASLPGFCAPGVPRALINLEQVGSLGSRADDVLILGDCDDGVRRLAKACGWLEELEKLWAATAPAEASAVDRKVSVSRSREDALEDEVAQISRGVEETLRLGEQQQQWLKEHDGDAKAKTKAAPGADADTETKPTALGSTESHPTKELSGLPDMGNVADHGESKAASPADIRRDSKPRVPLNDVGAGNLAHVFPHISSSGGDGGGRKGSSL